MSVPRAKQGHSAANEASAPERLQKALAAAGVGSRRACEEWIQAGRVRVNGQTVTELGTKVDLATDTVTFDGRPVRPLLKRYYIALNKPRGVVCSRQDVHAARLVTELVDLPSRPMLRPVGRLDADSEGLLFLTDDGGFLHALTHPSHHVPKTYRAEVRGIPSPDALKQLAQGIVLDDGLTAPAENVRLLRATQPPSPRPKTGDPLPSERARARGLSDSPSPAKREIGPGGEGLPADGLATVELTLYEGRKRQVRRMLAAVGCPVTRLTRVRIGSVRLTGLGPGMWRHLTPGEVTALLAQAAQAASKSEQPEQENTSTWQTAPSRLKPPKGASSPNSPKPKRPARLRTS